MSQEPAQRQDCASTQQFTESLAATAPPVPTRTDADTIIDSVRPPPAPRKQRKLKPWNVKQSAVTLPFSPAISLSKARNLIKKAEQFDRRVQARWISIPEEQRPLRSTKYHIVMFGQCFRCGARSRHAFREDCTVHHTERSKAKRKQD